jgi:hypothetical protein
MEAPPLSFDDLVCRFAEVSVYGDRREIPTVVLGFPKPALVIELCII